MLLFYYTLTSILALSLLYSRNPSRGVSHMIGGTAWAALHSVLEIGRGIPGAPPLSPPSWTSAPAPTLALLLLAPASAPAPAPALLLPAPASGSAPFLLHELPHSRLHHRGRVPYARRELQKAVPLVRPAISPHHHFLIPLGHVPQ